MAVQQQIRKDGMYRTTSQSNALHASDSSQLTLDCFVKKRPHPASIMADMKSNKRYRKPDWIHTRQRPNVGGYIISLLRAVQKNQGIFALIPKG